MQDFSHTGPVHKTPHRSIGFIYIIPLGLLIGFLLFAASQVWKTVTTDFSTATVSPSPRQQANFQISEAPSATPTVSSAKKDISIQVLNGSGVTGAAGKIADVLRAKGYTEIATGNADKYTYTGVIIRSGAENKTLAEQVKTDLEEDAAEIKVETADITSDAAVEVIVGKSGEDDEE